jgi:hypothetical protein
VLVALGFAVAAPRATAETITMTLDTAGNPVTYNPYGGAATTVGGGPFHWTQKAPINSNYTANPITYCIDLDDGISKGSTYTYTVQSNLALAPTIGTAATGAAVTELFDRYYNSSLTNSATAAAFQLALWDLIYDGSTRSLASGRIQGSNAQAQGMLSSLGTAYTNRDLANARLVALVSSTGNQDQIMVVPNKPANPVPAAPGLVLGAVGFGGLLLGRLRRRA